MKVRGLQQQLANTSYLLPSQRDLLSRLLFQLAFNDFSRMAIVGGQGSGKSTLALALAELFSESSEVTINVAMFQAPIAEDRLASQLGQQWFADANLSEQSLFQKLQQAGGDVLFALIADDAEHLTAGQYQWLLSLPVKLFLFNKQPDEHMQLSLTIPALTLSDCEQFLAAENLDALTLAERFANCQNNLHLLTRGNSLVRQSSIVLKSSKTPIVAASIGVALVLLFMVASWLKTTDDTTAQLVTALPAPPVTAPTPELAVPVNTDSIQPDDTTDLTTTAVTSTAEPISKSDANLSVPPDTAVMPESTQSSVPLPVAKVNPEPMPQPLPDEVLVDEPEATITLTAEEPKGLETAAVSVLDNEYLLNLAGRQLLVQLAVLSSEGALNRFKRNYPKVTVLVYRRSWQGRGQWVIVSGPFADNNSAKQFVQQLPSALSAAGPFIKTVSAAQQEIKAWQRLQLAESEQDN